MQVTSLRFNVGRFLRAVVLFPFHILMGNGAGEAAAVEVPAAAAAEPATGAEPAAAAAAAEKPTVEDKEREAAILRGDVLEEPAAESFSTEALAGVVKATGDLPAEEDKKPGPTVPLARLNEVLEENKRLKEQQNGSKPAAAATDEPAAVATEITALETKIAELQDKADDIFQESGPTEERKQILAEINRLNREIVKLDVQQEQSRERQQTEVATTLHAVAAEGYKLYPFLDISSADADVDAVNAVRFHRDQLIAEGKSPAEALQAAIDEKGPKFAKILGVAVPSKGAEVRTAREREALGRAADASVAQPAALPSRTDKDNFKVDVDALSGPQIKAMPEEEKARLRGDVL